MPVHPRRREARRSIPDHADIHNDGLHPLGERFIPELLLVCEQFLKLDVVFKAETDFADVIPQAKALLISIDLDPHELTDPRQIGVNVTGIGRWGNGNSEASVTESEDLPFFIALFAKPWTGS